MREPTTLTQSTAGLTSLAGLDLSQSEHPHAEVQTWQSPSGARVRFVQARQLPMVDLVLRFDAGSCQDSELSGLAALTLYMLDEGTDALDAAQFTEQIERLGAIVKSSLRLEHATLSLRSLSASALLTPALELFTAMVARPAFPAPELAKVKQQLHALQTYRAGLPVIRARSEAFMHLFAGHPYGNPYGSTTAGIDAATCDDLRAFHQRAYAANNLELSLVGDLSRSDAEAIVEQICQALPQGWAAVELPAIPRAEARKLHVELPGANTSMLMAVPMALQASEPEYAAMVLASEVLGTGLDSRLMRELRQQLGLTYDVHSRLSPLSAGGFLSIEWSVAVAYVEASEQRVMALLSTFIEQGPSDSELDVARQQVIGRLLRTVATNQSLVAMLSENGHLRLPADHLERYLEQLLEVTPHAVRDVLNHRLDLTRPVLVSVGTVADQQPLPAPPASDQ
ncbi:pitrilysin family protein [Pseudomonas sp. BP8]|uniref:M16 family metallopeptidase n=1 Tax=Pseudomonas sp. BP8 TaxID=2817864 RepID=UPI001AEB9A02|nr:pitrilysin family protein [Pseudomonas sp. BP8]MBP2259941.1 zinc protease [Pseudomonas sp. BP8]HDS1736872.1 insulinase family protein [Pseudomonas putida]